jgi:hypothetical protein
LETLTKAAPDDHLASGPHCRVRVSTLRGICEAGIYPAVGVGIVSPTSV